ncbi:MAG TPA: hypothetical protein VGN39_07650 [Terriglobales bacterium]|nr:hypothetical protein [Terriglobales bacterium]
MTRQAPRLLLTGGLFVYSASLCAQDSPAPKPQGSAPTAAANETETAALAKATQNPLASLISVPFQNNTIFGTMPCA